MVSVGQGVVDRSTYMYLNSLTCLTVLVFISWAAGVLHLDLGALRIKSASRRIISVLAANLE